MIRPAFLPFLLFASCAAPAPAPEGGEIRLLVRADDMGVSHGMNQGCLRSVQSGIARSIEVIVPGPWFSETVKMLRDHPGIDVGVHLCLTSEWENLKWGPLTHAPSLVGADGAFHPMTRQRKDFPPGTGFLEGGPKPEEVERELRAQIEQAVKRLPRVTHLSAHMGAAVATPELRAITEKLSKEYRLPLAPPDLKRVRGFGGHSKSAAEKERGLVKILRNLGPGTWLLITHPATDAPEMKALGHLGYENVGEDRHGVSLALTSPRVREVIRSRSIRLVSYADLAANR